MSKLPWSMDLMFAVFGTFTAGVIAVLSGSFSYHTFLELLIAFPIAFLICRCF